MRRVTLQTTVRRIGGQARRALIVFVILFVACMLGYMAAYVVSSGKPLLILPILLFLATFAISLKSYQLLLLFGIFSLPFTQVPTIKFLFRWRISELIGWLLLPLHFHFLIVSKKHIRKSIARLCIWSILAYFLYTGIIGVVHLPFLQIQVWAAIEYTGTPLFRLMLETARGLASVSLMIGLLRIVRSFDDFRRVIAIFAASGSIAGAYGIYNSVALKFGLPLLPETLSQAQIRPFGTFYEPTGLGSFTAATILVTLYFVIEESKLMWILCLFFTIGGLFFSLSRVGILGLFVGLAILIWALSLRIRSLLKLFLMFPAIVAILWPVYLLGEEILEDLIARHWNEAWFRVSLAQRREAYTMLPQIIMQYPMGFGQGLFLFHGGGVPGFARLAIEGGVIGLFVLGMIYLAGFTSLKNLLRCREMVWRRIAPFILATYICTLITTLNYINTTDMWIWFVWGLPILAWNGASCSGTTGHYEHKKY